MAHERYLMVAAHLSFLLFGWAWHSREKVSGDVEDDWVGKKKESGSPFEGSRPALSSTVAHVAMKHLECV